ncbi:hypothetical protein NA56DRAFT_225129 [Hyaloscypha hepaticicola]|uniref:Uncharacterized protein n=1 Tax=Hyaloscypha hepaticicola TaxID=2082293 RepID=A0A2J6QLH8_9HELO|nr:hypothetical protein NA56DRAFT_225129 [Hyaloscypha hepaticicola]
MPPSFPATHPSIHQLIQRREPICFSLLFFCFSFLCPTENEQRAFVQKKRRPKALIEKIQSPHPFPIPFPPPCSSREAYILSNDKKENVV